MSAGVGFEHLAVGRDGGVVEIVHGARRSRGEVAEGVLASNESGGQGRPVHHPHFGGQVADGEPDAAFRASVRTGCVGEQAVVNGDLSGIEQHVHALRVRPGADHLPAAEGVVRGKGLFVRLLAVEMAARGRSACSRSRGWRR